MDIKMERWIDQFHDEIPFDIYTTKLLFGEEHGLYVELSGRHWYIMVDFGIVRTFQVLDEGTQLNNPPGYIDDPQFMKFRDAGFPSTIYLIKNGWFEDYIRTCIGAELFQAFHLRQYNLVTLNYVMMIIASERPVISVRPIAADSKR